MRVHRVPIEYSSEGDWGAQVGFRPLSEHDTCDLLMTSNTSTSEAAVTSDYCVSHV